MLKAPEGWVGGGGLGRLGKAQLLGFLASPTPHPLCLYFLLGTQKSEIVF